MVKSTRTVMYRCLILKIEASRLPTYMEKVQGVSETSKTGRKHRYYYCFNQRKKQCTLKPLRKDDLEARVAETAEDFLDDEAMLASLAVDMAVHYRETHERGTAVLEALEARRKGVAAKLANFVKAIAAGIFNDATAEAMQVLEDQKRELDGAIQAEHVKAAPFEDEVSIGTFYKKYAGATMDAPETRDLLLEYFMDKIFVGPGELTIASWFFDHGAEVTFEELSDAKEMGEALTIEFNASPRGGDGGNRTRVRRRCTEASPGAVREECFLGPELGTNTVLNRRSWVEVPTVSPTNTVSSGFLS